MTTSYNMLPQFQVMLDINSSLLNSILLISLFLIVLVKSRLFNDSSSSSSGSSDSGTSDSDAADQGTSDSNAATPGSNDAADTPDSSKSEDEEKWAVMVTIVKRMPIFSNYGKNKSNLIISKQSTDEKAKIDWKAKLQNLWKVIKKHCTIFNAIAIYFYYIFFKKIIICYWSLILVVFYQLLILFILNCLLFLICYNWDELKHFFRNLRNLTILSIFDVAVCLLLNRIMLQLWNNVVSLINLKWLNFVIFLLNMLNMQNISIILCEILYTCRFEFADLLKRTLGGFTLLSLYLWPYIYIIGNIISFVKYAWGESYYRDPFFCYISQIIAIYLLRTYPITLNKELVNAGRISSLLRWLYWNFNFKKVIAIAYVKSKSFLKYFIQNYLRSILTWLGIIIALYMLYLSIEPVVVTQDSNDIACYTTVKKNKRSLDKVNESFESFCGFSSSFGDNIKEKLFDILPINYKITQEFLNFEWINLLNIKPNFNLNILKYLNNFYIFILKKSWLFLKYLVYTKCKESLIEFYCTLSLWIEWYMFKYLGLFLEAHLYIPIYIDFITNHIMNTTWCSLLDMFEHIWFFGLIPIMRSIEAYYVYRTTMYVYQYQFWENHRYEYGKKKKIYNCSYTTLYWSLYLKFFFSRRSASNKRVINTWSHWWY